ncbi:MAG: hypothetical protein M3430_18440 [Acidobacteriota bacterium]|nr:hypothetical protein [Acidobacteriota bacterium]
MATKSKNSNGSGAIPALQFEHVERRESKPYLMNTRVLEMIEMYPLYVESLTGHRPEESEVVEKCVEMILGSDTGFKKFAANRTGKTAARSSNHAVNPANGNTKSTAQSA